MRKLNDHVLPVNGRGVSRRVILFSAGSVPSRIATRRFSCSLYDEEPVEPLEPLSTADFELTVCTPAEIRTMLAELEAS
jgi:hypothetical protein